MNSGGILKESEWEEKEELPGYTDFENALKLAE